MANTVTPPRADISIAHVLIDGKRYDCVTSMEFVRFFQTLFQRVGGVTAETLDDTSLLFFAQQTPNIGPVQNDVNELESLLGQRSDPRALIDSARQSADETKALLNSLRQPKPITDWNESTKTLTARAISSDSTLTITSTVANKAVTISTLATTGTTASGAITIQPGTSQNILPGNVSISGANTTGTAAASNGGNVLISGGNGNRSGGGVNQTGGQATNTGAGLSVGGSFINSGGPGYKTGGVVSINGGAVTGPTGTGGIIYLTPGVGAGAGADGSVHLQDANGNDVIVVGTNGVGGATTIGEFGATPVVQAVAGAGAGFANGAGAAVLAGFSSTGGVGASAYTLDDIVYYFKQRGTFAL